MEKNFWSKKWWRNLFHTQWHIHVYLLTCHPNQWHTANHPEYQQPGDFSTTSLWTSLVEEAWWSNQTLCMDYCEINAVTQDNLYMYILSSRIVTYHNLGHATRFLWEQEPAFKLNLCAMDTLEAHIDDVIGHLKLAFLGHYALQHLKTIKHREPRLTWHLLHHQV